ncbi:sensor histidine kinase [Dongia deserti]|uniref:sensor histidine kinase n=1 Tax=Dongia deserti TaxID=2268030 RepID=UPI000E64EF57|nr:HAMP domain-containing sensor histidine kinase [Dongia deserti]
MSEEKAALPGFGRGLSARLLALTICFVMVSEVLIYVPSIARFRDDWLSERLATAYLAILALEATPDYMIDPQLEIELLENAGARLIALRTPDGKNLIMRGSTPANIIISRQIDLSDQMPTTLIKDAFEQLSSGGGRLLRVRGQTPQAGDAWIDVVLDDTPLHQAMISYSWRIVGLSIVISLVTAALIFAALQWLLIRPMRNLTQRMVDFRANPEDMSRDDAAARRSDEIGVAERELLQLQKQIRKALKQRERLAALGTAVSKINHDLRGVLATAQLVADRLAHSDNPEVKKMAPSLVRSLDRAISLCTDTLNFTREGPTKPEYSRFPLAELHGEVGESLGKYLNGAVVLQADFAQDFTLTADRAQLYRVIHNLAENALQMGAHNVAIRARRADGKVEIEVADDGPGLPPKALQNLFAPFKGSARSGGTGLGLAIARELMRVQGGDLKLAANDAKGATFLLELPDRQSA